MTPAMGQMFSSFPLLSSLAYPILCGESLCALASAQVEDRISLSSSWWQPVQAVLAITLQKAHSPPLFLNENILCSRGN